MKFHIENKNFKLGNECLREILFVEDKKNNKKIFNKKGLPSICQIEVLVKVPETRNMELKLDKKFNKKDAEKFFKILKKLINCLGKDWYNFIKIIKYISIVKFEGRTDAKYFSGTFTDALGSIHMCKPFTELNILECLTHEASHFWLDKLEKNNKEFAKNGWVNNKYYSPWRKDKRPISGVIHAVYVFSRVASALVKYFEKNKKKKILDRAAYLSAQVRQGIQEINNCSEVKTLGKEINLISLKTIECVEQIIPNNILKKNFVIVENKRKQKIKK